jgi:hypothetical protein
MQLTATDWLKNLLGCSESISQTMDFVRPKHVIPSAVDVVLKALAR